MNYKDSILKANNELIVPRAIVGGVPVDAYNRDILTKSFVEKTIGSDNEPPALVFSMNGEGIFKYHNDKDFKHCIDSANIIHADGMSVVKAANKFTNIHFSERIATTDFFHDIAKACVENSLSLYFLGAREEVVQLATDRINKLYPGIKIVGFHHGYFKDNSIEEDSIVSELNELKPDVVFVGLGRPRQEEWCLRMRDRLHGIAWLKTCGGLFDFLSGRASRAPQWMIDSGFEWLYRMLHDPRRLFWRYLVTNCYSLYCFRFKR